jgi:hypothetical protein
MNEHKKIYRFYYFFFSSPGQVGEVVEDEKAERLEHDVLHHHCKMRVIGNHLLELVAVFKTNIKQKQSAERKITKNCPEANSNLTI